MSSEIAEVFVKSDLIWHFTLHAVYMLAEIVPAANVPAEPFAGRAEQERATD